jgi:hypothetical protein
MGCTGSAGTFHCLEEWRVFISPIRLIKIYGLGVKAQIQPHLPAAENAERRGSFSCCRCFNEMVHACAVPGCISRSDREIKLSFHRLPLKNKEALKQWIHKIGKGLVWRSRPFTYRSTGVLHHQHAKEGSGTTCIPNSFYCRESCSSSAVS